MHQKHLNIFVKYVTSDDTITRSELNLHQERGTGLRYLLQTQKRYVQRTRKLLEKFNAELLLMRVIICIRHLPDVIYQKSLLTSRIFFV